jgi:hypothetical protein
MNADKRQKLETGNWKLAKCLPWRRIPSFAFRVSIFLLLSAFICAHPWLPSTLRAQDAKEEVVANLAAGRVTIFVAKDGILVATQGNEIERGARMPVVVPLSSRRVAILMGAVEWAYPSLGKPTLRLARELPGLLGQIAGPKRIEQEQIDDIEKLGMALLEPLRPAAAALRSKIDIGEDEPVVQMLIVGYAEEYGAEVWQLNYRLRQELLRGEYWRTRVLNPSYEQLYPPEKGQPRKLIDSRYPPEDVETGVAGLFEASDPRLARVAQISPQAAKAEERLRKGESNKAELAGATDFFRAALNAVVPEKTPLGLLVIREARGFDWVIAPPERPELAAEPAKPREPGAPTLRKP